MRAAWTALPLRPEFMKARPLARAPVHNQHPLMGSGIQWLANRSARVAMFYSLAMSLSLVCVAYSVLTRRLRLWVRRQPGRSSPAFRALVIAALSGTTVSRLSASRVSGSISSFGGLVW
jgi:hypothetical protein